MRYYLILSLLFLTPLFAATSPDDALAALVAGNQRFMDGKPNNFGNSFAALKKQKQAQFPCCAILACSDSRVSPEILFDRTIGDLFVVRLAGNVASQTAMESLDFACGVLNVPLIVVMGHQNCGAVKAAMDASTDDELGSIATLILPAVKDNSNLRETILRNVHVQIARLEREPLLRKKLQEKSLKIVGAYFDFSNGKVEFLKADK